MTKYLLIGHITEDLTPSGTQLGGTVSYAGLTAKVLGADVRVLTACHANTDLSPLSSLDLSACPPNTPPPLRTCKHPLEGFRMCTR